MTVRVDGRRRTKVLMLVDSLDFDPGGAERVIVGLATHLPKDRYEVSLCTTRDYKGELLEQVRASGIRHLGLDRHTRLDLLAWRPLVEFIRDEQVDILHAHMFGSNFWGTLLGRVCRVPVVIAHEHAWSYEGKPYRRLLDGYFIGRFASMFLTVANRDAMIEWERVPEHKVELMPNPYIPRQSTNGGDLRAELGIEPDAQVIGTIARLRPQKALDVLVEAFSIVANSLPRAALVIAGDGPCRAELEQQAADLGMRERVRFIGAREDLDVVLRGFDVAAMSSRFEGMPLFGLECMAHATPLVATDVGGLSDLFENGRTALLVPSGDPGALARALERLLLEPARGRALARAAQAEIDKYSIESVIAAYEALYQRLLAGSVRVRAGRA
jgi:glycosyltransferase involved in cell wall biosynthesis